MSTQRNLELTGDADSVSILTEVFTAISGGRQLPTAATSTEEQAYSHETTTYLTPQGDGLTILEIRDYGEYHRAQSPSLVVGAITVASVGRPRSTEVVLNISAPAELIDEATETVKRIAIANGLTFVRYSSAGITDA